MLKGAPKLISVIVPVYNASKYLNRTLSSVLNQKYERLQLILIDDGSTDDSYDICQKYLQIDSRVQLFQQENSGVSSARNRGLEHATGEYIIFMDSDDWLSEDYLAVLAHSQIVGQADLVIAPFVRESGKGSFINTFNLVPDRVLSGSSLSTQILLKLFGPVGTNLKHPARLDDISSVWGKLYKGDIARRLSFRNIDEVGSEDLLYNIQFVLESDRAIYTEKTFYHYFKQNEQSLVHSFRPQMLDSWITLESVMDDLVVKRSLPQEFREAASNRLAVNVLNLSRNICSSNLSFRNKIIYLKKVLNDDAIVSALHQLPMENLSFFLVFVLYNGQI